MAHDADGPRGGDRAHECSVSGAGGEEDNVQPRAGEPDRPARGGHVSRGAEDDPAAAPEVGGEDLGRRDTVDVDDDPYLLALIEARVQAELHQHQHIHLPASSNVEQMVELRERAPEAYALWIETMRSRNDHEIWLSRRTVRQPYLLANFGQFCGLFAVFGAFAVAGYALYQGSTVVAGILGVVNVIGLAAVFNGSSRTVADEDVEPPY